MVQILRRQQGAGLNRSYIAHQSDFMAVPDVSNLNNQLSNLASLVQNFTNIDQSNIFHPQSIQS